MRYMEHVEQKDTDLSSAKLIGESHNVVRIMTIHKSKGLEFPVVFITGGGKRFNKSSKESRVLLHKDLGIAPELVDFENGFRAETPQRSVFRQVADAEQISEEIRKLYVATTRAKELLYFVATISGNIDKSGNSKLQKTINEWKSMIVDDTPTFTANEVLSASGFADWVAPVAIASENWDFAAINHTKITKSCMEDTLYETDDIPGFDPLKILDFKYPYSDLSAVPTKVSVTSLKGDMETAIIPKPVFLQEKAPDGAFFGTALHKVMEHFIPRPDLCEEDVAGFIEKLIRDNLLSQKEADLINPQKVVKFYSSETGKRIIKSNKVFREQAFEVEIPVSTAYPEIKVSNENILLQGVIDCFFEEDGELVLVDYKTDRYNDVSEIHEKYDRQLELYKYALEKITNKKVKEKIIYLFSTDSHT